MAMQVFVILFLALQVARAALGAVNTPIGYTNSSIVGTSFCEEAECSMGDLYCDALLAYAASSCGAQICIANSDSFKASIPAGPISQEAFDKAFIYVNDTVAVLKVTGSVIKAALEHGFSSLGNTSDVMFPQVAGINVTIDASAPVGSRVKSLTVKNVSLVPSNEYTLVTNSFLAKGGYGYSWGYYTNVTGHSVSLNSVIESYLAAHNPYVPVRQSRIFGTVIGVASSMIEGGLNVCSEQECDVGNLICDALLAIAGTPYGAEVCLVDGGIARASIPAGPITTDEVAAALPFADVSYVLQVPGSTLRAALEHGLSAIGDSSLVGQFPQIGGMKVTYRPSNPVGRRVSSVMVGTMPLDDTKKYTLVTVDYVANGGNGYAWPGSSLVNADRIDATVVAEEYLTLNDPYKPPAHGRLTAISV